MDFRGFVESQDDDREIDHHAGWSSCAVGDYIDAVGTVDINASIDPENILKILGGDKSLYHSLSFDGYMVRRLVDDRVTSVGVDPVIVTYGDLKKYYRGELDIVDNS